MNFGSPAKLDCAVRVAAALGFVGLVNLERVGVGCVRDQVAEGWPPTRAGVTSATRSWTSWAGWASGGTSPNDGLASYAARLRRAGHRASSSRICSIRGLRSRAARPARALGFDDASSTCSPGEMNPELAGDLRLIDSETGEMRELSMDGDASGPIASGSGSSWTAPRRSCRSQEIGYHRIASDGADRGVRCSPQLRAAWSHGLLTPTRACALRRGLTGSLVHPLARFLKVRFARAHEWPVLLCWQLDCQRDQREASASLPAAPARPLMHPASPRAVWRWQLPWPVTHGAAMMGRGARKVVVVLDTSASMKARDVSPSRFDARAAEAA